MRKNTVKPFYLVTAGDMSQATVTSSALNTINLDNIGIIVSWLGTSPSGAITVQVRNNLNSVTSSWVDLDFGGAITVSGNTGAAAININQTPFDELRVIYTKSSGIGSLDVIVSAKTVGA